MIKADRRVVITGMGIISPIGCSADSLWQSVEQGVSGIGPLTRVPPDHLNTRVAAEVSDFTGSIDDFGELEKMTKRSIKKGLKLMCREIQMGVAASQLCLADSQLSPEVYDPHRFGTMFGSDYIITEPWEFNRSVQHCLDAEHRFDPNRWGEQGIGQIDPLWLLKYLPNMPASHVAIYNDLRGPSNSITVREASANLAVGEAATIIQRDIADQMLVGATGSRIHLLRTLHVVLQEQMVDVDDPRYGGDPQRASRPFDLDRSGMVLGEGAGSLVLESLDVAESRGAEILGEVVGHASTSVADARGVANYRQAFVNVLRGALRSADISPAEVGHINAHGLSSVRCDREEAEAIREVMGDEVPVLSLKGHMGNMGAGSGLVELNASLLCMRHGRLFKALNYDTPDPDCPIHVVNADGVEPGDLFINLSISMQGQASAVAVRRFS
ncbi:MAG: beta-ketoacyl-[acyl-carrier-protein] synthase family protein [Planctomycetota bacterium]|nr:beta-ketoacyl-[acyl-carrier-protein] synthase family protein [Planctomycetota bacterium]